MVSQTQVQVRVFYFLFFTFMTSEANWNVEKTFLNTDYETVGNMDQFWLSNVEQDIAESDRTVLGAMTDKFLDKQWIHNPTFMMRFILHTSKKLQDLENQQQTDRKKIVDLENLVVAEKKQKEKIFTELENNRKLIVELNLELTETKRCLAQMQNISEEFLSGVKNYAGLSKRLEITSTSRRAAFSAFLSTDPTDLGRQAIIPFDKTVYNENNAFDTVMHTFICPFDGIYYFHSSLMVKLSQHVELEMVKDGLVLIRIFAAGATSGYGFDQGSNSVVTRCNQGEHVWVRVYETVGTTVDDFGTTFSGFFLWEV